MKFFNKKGSADIAGDVEEPLKKKIPSDLEESEKGAIVGPGAGDLENGDIPLDDGGDKPERGNWSGRLDFLMSLIAYAVGLGNVWRFPYLCFKNGGGAFLIPYAICWILAAVPIFLLEVAAGQFLQRGGIGVWKVCPLFKGVGFANVMISGFCTIYYCIIVAWALFYLFSSFHQVLPWVTCDHGYNDVRCLHNSTNRTQWLTNLIDEDFSVNDTQSPVEQFWERKVLETTSTIDNTGHIQWQLALLLLLAWILVYFALWKGIVHARKLVYFCALSPYVLLIILLGRGASLDGAGAGVGFYLKPNMTKLLSTTVWRDAGTQVFYSYGIGFGAIIALGSYNTYHHNCYLDTLSLCGVNACTSLMAGFVVFSVLGHLAHVAKKSVGEVVKSGVGLAFLVYPEVVAVLPISQLWSVLFFTMIAILGLDSQVCMVEGIMTTLGDAFPRVIRKHKETAVAIFCVVGYFLGLTMVTQAGQYWLTLIDGCGASGFTLLVVVFFEVVGLSWGFGGERVYKAMEDMLGFRINRIWLFGWKYTAPLVCIVIFLLTIIKYEPIEMSTGRPFPVWAQALGFMMSLTSILMIPGCAIFVLLKNPGTFMERLRKAMKPSVPLPYNEGPDDNSSEDMTGAEELKSF